MKLRSLLVLAFLLAACGPADGGAPVDANTGPCTEGATRCSDRDLQVCASGEFVLQEACPNACTPGFGCTFCTPNEGTCNGQTSRVCRADGTATDDFFCDPLQGMSCGIDTGLCAGACAAQNIGTNYIGCEYYPTVTGNEVDSNFEFAVVISNTGSQDADIHIEGGALATPLITFVRPGETLVQRLPWETSLKGATCFGTNGCGGLASNIHSVIGKAYHLRSSQPVTVYQFSPIDYALGTQNSYTNDASLLIPSNAMGRKYITAGWPALAAGFPSTLTVTASRDNTQVTIISKANVPALPNGRVRILRIVATGGNTTIVYNPPQVGAANFLSQPGEFIELLATDEAFEISADHRIMVSEFMIGETLDGNPGDPSITLAVPSDQYRTEYLFHAPINYPSSYVNVVAPATATIMLDGSTVSGFMPIGTTMFSVARVLSIAPATATTS